MHWDAIVSAVIAGGTAVLGFSGAAGAAADVAILSSIVFAGVAGYAFLQTCIHR